MSEKIFEDFGLTIFRHEGAYFAEYDSGGSASWMLRNHITSGEAAKAQRSEQDAYEVLIAAEQRTAPIRI